MKASDAQLKMSEMTLDDISASDKSVSSEQTADIADDMSDKLKTVHYIHEISASLGIMANQNDLPFLGYLLEMVSLEAASLDEAGHLDL